MKEKNSTMYPYQYFLVHVAHVYAIFKVSTYKSFNLYIPMLYLNLFNLIDSNSFVNKVTTLY